MSYDAQKLYDLLPAIYRLRDADQQGALRELLSVIAREMGVLEESLAQLYDDQFIETCAEWVIPYIGDLVGCRALHTSAPVRHSSRAEVANTIAYRRRKGTAAILEQLARDVTGWSARAVEFFEVLAATQHLNHIRPHRLQSPDLRQGELLEQLDSAFDTIAHTVDVRRIAVGRGWHNIPSVGIFLWRLDPQPLTGVPAHKLNPSDASDGRYLFNPLGCDSQLYTKPVAEDEITHLAEPRNVPAPISRRALQARLADYYGDSESIAVFVDDRLVPTGDVQVRDLRDAGGAWAEAPGPGKIAMDPILGRLVLAPDFGPSPVVQATWHHVFSMEMGGGEYERQASFEPSLAESGTILVRHGEKTIRQALAELGTDSGVVEIADSWTYSEKLAIRLGERQRVELRAANGCRPLVRPTEPLVVKGGVGAEFYLNGLVIADQPIHVRDSVARVCIRHCTLVPGLALDPEKASLVLRTEGVKLELDHSITGPIRLRGDASATVADSIVDAGAEDGAAYCEALHPLGAGGALEMRNSTVIGKVYAREMPLVTNSILSARLASHDDWSAPVWVVRRQEGCIRFSWLAARSLVPRRHRCQPDTEVAARIGELEFPDPVSAAERERGAADVTNWLVPVFASTQYGDGDYCQLHSACPRQVVTGADDEAEMGAFHDAFWPQREANLRLRLREYLRFGLEAGVLHASQRPLQERTT